MAIKKQGSHCLDNCTQCGVSFIGDDILECFKAMYHEDPQAAASAYGYPRVKNFRREIGIEVSEVYDGIILYKCPDCNHVWKRFSWVTDEVLNKWK